MDKNEFRVLIKHCFLMGKNTVKAKQWLDKCYPDSAPSITTVKRWYADFKRGRRNTDDAERSGRPNSAVVSENITKIHEMILSDRKLKLREIAMELKISEGSVFTILREHLSMKKLCSKWVPRLLTPDQKKQRIFDSERCLELFKRDEQDFLRRYVTVNETWIHHYTPDSKTSAGKVMASVFWDVQGILFIDYFDKGKKISSEYYIKLLDRLCAEIIKKRPQMQEKKILFHQDDAPCHISMETMVKLNELRFQLLDHPAFSPDLSPSDYWLFADLEKMLQGKKFGSNEEVIAEVEAYFERKDKSFYRKGIEKLEERWSTCITLEGDYVEE